MNNIFKKLLDFLDYDLIIVLIQSSQYSRFSMSLKFFSIHLRHYNFKEGWIERALLGVTIGHYKIQVDVLFLPFIFFWNNPKPISNHESD